MKASSVVGMHEMLLCNSDGQKLTKKILSISLTIFSYRSS